LFGVWVINDFDTITIFSLNIITNKNVLLANVVNANGFYNMGKLKILENYCQVIQFWFIVWENLEYFQFHI